jgi:hypothetical protein
MEAISYHQRTKISDSRRTWICPLLLLIELPSIKATVVPDIGYKLMPTRPLSHSHTAYGSNLDEAMQYFKIVVQYDMICGRYNDFFVNSDAIYTQFYPCKCGEDEIRSTTKALSPPLTST